MNPVLIEEIDPAGQNKQRDEDDDDESLHSVKHTGTIKHAESSDVSLQNLAIKVQLLREKRDQKFSAELARSTPS